MCHLSHHILVVIEDRTEEKNSGFIALWKWHKKRGNDIFYKHHNFSNLVQNFDEKSFRLGCLCFLFHNWGLSPFFCSKCQMIGVDCTSAHSNPLKGFSSPMAITYLTHSGHEYAIPGNANGGAPIKKPFNLNKIFETDVQFIVLMEWNILNFPSQKVIHTSRFPNRFFLK